MSLVSRCTIEVNGRIVSFVKISEDEIELGKVVKLMGGSDVVDQTPVYKFTVTYAKPKNGPVFDWTTLNGGTFTVNEEGGERITYSPCQILKIGKSDTDDDNAKTMDVDFWAKTRTVE